MGIGMLNMSLQRLVEVVDLRLVVAQRGSPLVKQVLSMPSERQLSPSVKADSGNVQK